MTKRIKGALRVIGMSFEIELRRNLTDGFVLFGIVIQPLIVAFTALWMLKDKGPDYAIFYCGRFSYDWSLDCSIVQ